MTERDSAGPSFVIVGGGPEKEPQRFASLLKESVVIAADGGWRHCRAVGITATLLIGDMDTLTPDEIAQAQSVGTEVRRFSSDKDQSDLELAILAAHHMGARRMTLLGALGGQWDHCLANLLAPLSLCQSLGVWARLLTEGAEIYLLGPGAYILRDQVGSRASLAALSEQVDGLSLGGFRYNLDKGSIARRETLGLANSVFSSQATVNLGCGELLLTLVRPGA